MPVYYTYKHGWAPYSNVICIHLNKQRQEKTEEDERPVGVHDEGVATVLPAELHHQSELVDPPGFLEQRHQVILVHVSGNLPNEHLTTPRGGRTLPACTTDTVS